MRRPVAFVVSLAFLLGCAMPEAESPKSSAPSASAHPDLRPGESVRETDDVFPGGGWIDPDTHVSACRIVDAWTGDPIAGAKLHVPEHRFGPVGPEKIGCDTQIFADSDGWLRFAGDDAAAVPRLDYFVIEAPGYAPGSNWSPGLARYELVPGMDVPFVLLDFCGEPVSDAFVAFMGGRYDTPILRLVRTDANGRGVFESIDPFEVRGQLILVGSDRTRLGARKLSRGWRPGDPPVELHVSPGVVVEGRVIDDKGDPVAKAQVPLGIRPWAVTGLDGRFRVTGLQRWESMVVSFPPDYDEADDVGFLVLPEWEPVEITRDRGMRPTVWLAVRCVDGDDQPAVGLRVVAIRLADGLASTAFTGARGYVDLPLSAGRYRIVVEGNLGPFGDATTEVDVPDLHASRPDSSEGADPRAPEVTICVPRNPVVRVDFSRLPLSRVGCSIVTASRVRSVRPSGEDRVVEVPVPTTERAVLRVSHAWTKGEGFVRHFPIPDRTSPEARDPIVLDWAGEKRVTARLVGEDGVPVLGELLLVRDRFRSHRGDWEKSENESAHPTASTYLEGRFDWMAKPAAPGYGCAYGTVDLPAEAMDIDLGEIRLPRRDPDGLRMRVPAHVDPDDDKYRPPYVRSRGFRHERKLTSWRRECDHVLTDASHLEEGDVLVLPSCGSAELRLDGPPPWELDWPTASVELTIHDPDGSTIIASLLVDGRPSGWSEEGTWDPWEAEYKAPSDGTYVFEGLTTGRHQLILTADGYRSTILDLDIAEGERRRIRVTMNRRTAAHAMEESR